MKMAEEKKKKGMVVVIAVGGKSPKSPEHTADPEEKKKSVAVKKAWNVLKEEYDPVATRRLRNQEIIDNEKNNWPEGVERSLDKQGNILLDGIPHDEYMLQQL